MTALAWRPEWQSLLANGTVNNPALNNLTGIIYGASSSLFTAAVALTFAYCRRLLLHQGSERPRRARRLRLQRHTDRLDALNSVSLTIVRSPVIDVAHWQQRDTIVLARDSAHAHEHCCLCRGSHPPGSCGAGAALIAKSSQRRGAPPDSAWQIQTGKDELIAIDGKMHCQLQGHHQMFDHSTCRGS